MNKVKSWITRHKALTTIIVIIAVPLTLIFTPYKATNPDNPLFIPALFRLSDYNFRESALRHALKVLFPVGTDKKYVDLMLADRGGAERMDVYALHYSQEKNWISYTYSNLRVITDADPWKIDVYYDANDKLKIIMLGRRVINGVWIREEHLTPAIIQHEKDMAAARKRLGLDKHPYLPTTNP